MDKVTILRLIQDLDNQFKYRIQQENYFIVFLSESWLESFKTDKNGTFQHLKFITESSDSPQSHKKAAFYVLNEIKYKYYADY